MKKFFFATLSLLLSQNAFAQDKIFLVCKGWIPYYTHFARGAENQAGNDNQNYTVELDRKEKTINVLTQIGQVITPLSENPEFYYGKKEMDYQAYGEIVSAVSVSVNRLTGETMVGYDFKGKNSGKTAFLGTCKPGKQMF